MLFNGFQEVSGIGQVPLDWEFKIADMISYKITKGTTPPKSEISKGGNIPFLRVNNLSFNGVLDQNSDFIFVSSAAHNKFLARSKAYPGDVLMNIVGPPLGKISLLDDSYNEYNMNQAIVFYRLRTSQVDIKYFLNFLNSSQAQQWLQSRSKKTSGQQNLTIEACKQLPVPIPPLSEQKKIAQILSTWDKAITTTEQLLANSQQQKKALMQQLLTGKKRLLDDNGVRFSGEWKWSKIQEVGMVVTGSTPPKSDENNYGGDVLWATAEDFTGKYVSDTKIKLSDKGSTTARIVPKGSVLVTCIASIGKNAIANEDMGTNQQINAVVVSDSFSNEFFYYQIEFNVNKLISIAGVTAVPIVNKSSFQQVKLIFPVLEEQQKIAAVLSAADAEISALMQKITHLQDEKKALMQQLLTGKRRVKTDDKEVA